MFRNTSDGTSDVSGNAGLAADTADDPVVNPIDVDNAATAIMQVRWWYEVACQPNDSEKSDISEDEGSPLHGASLAERDVAIREARNAHQWVQEFFQNQNAGGAASSSHVNAVADPRINMLSGHGEENEEESGATSDNAMETRRRMARERREAK
eukprot:s1539_g1.t1